jgi:hypothetical protein
MSLSECKLENTRSEPSIIISTLLELQICFGVLYKVGFWAKTDSLTTKLLLVLVSTFFVMSPTGLMTMFYSLAALGVLTILFSANIRWSVKLLVVHSSTVILGYESHGTHGHVLLSGGSGSFDIIFSAKISWSVKLFVFHASTVILGFLCRRDPWYFHYQASYVFWNGASSSTREVWLLFFTPLLWEHRGTQPKFS